MFAGCIYNPPINKLSRGTYSGILKQEKYHSLNYIWKCNHQHKTAPEALACAELAIKIIKRTKEKQNE